MFILSLARLREMLVGFGVACLLLSGCTSLTPPSAPAEPTPPVQPVLNSPAESAPTELNKSSLPTYVIEAPDILLIDAVKLVPKPPYRVEVLDILQVLVTGTLLDQPITGQYPVDPSGSVDLGPAYGKVLVSGLTIDEATAKVEGHLKQILKQPEVSITLAQSAGQQQIAGEHLVSPDGTVNLGTYGRVYVQGMTLQQAQQAIEAQLEKKLQDPQVSLDVFAYNSKVYYIVTEGAGFGDQIVRVPITGNETVLDALSQVNGITRSASKKMWIARPGPRGLGCDQVLPVNYAEITKGAATATNYQILPGDRLFIAEDKFIAFDSFIDKITGPFERAFGFTLLGAQSIQTLNRFPLGFSGGQT